MLYSKSENGFFHPERHANSMPDDAKNISDARYQELISDIRKGAQLKPDSSGDPEAVFLTAPSVEDLLEGVKAELRTMRAPMLDALTGIAGRAARAGNDALASEADALAGQLLDITDDAALNTATTYEAMQAAGVAAYKRMAASSSPELVSVFREITGA